jgi:signal peptidase I
MNYKGAYGSGTAYNKGDVVVYTDGVAYVAIASAAAGITPHEERCWARLDQPLQEVVQMFKGYLDGINAAIPDNISDEAITLKTDDGEYLITVDDSGDTPELEVTAIEEEAADGEGGDT